MRDVICNDQGCKLESPNKMQVGGGVDNNVAYLSASSNGLQPQSGSLLIPLSAAKGSTPLRRRRRKRQVGGKKQIRKVKKRQTGGRKIVRKQKRQVGGKKIKIKRLQAGGSRKKSVRRKCVR